MNPKTFSIRQSLSAAWQIFKQRPLFFVVLPFLPVIASSLFMVGGAFITSGLTQLSKQNPSNSTISQVISSITLIEQILSWILSAVVGLGVKGILKETVEGKQKHFADLFSYKYAFIASIVAAILVGLGSMVGFLLLVIPGIIFAVAVQFYMFTVLTPGTSPVAAIQESMRITKGARLKLFLFGIALALFNLVGLLLFLVGILITAPVSELATAYVFKKLKDQSVDDVVKGKKVATTS